MMLTAFLLLSLVAISQAKNTYLVTAPEVLTIGQPYSVSVNILNASEPVMVKTAILRSWYNNSRTIKEVIVEQDTTFTQDNPGVVTLTVPRDTERWSYQPILKVTGTGGLVFEREESISFARKTISVFIQTDKALYKPGQRVHFRTFAVYPDLTIYRGPMDVNIFDARNNRIQRFVGMKDDSSVHQRDMLLSDQPVLGDWSIKVTVPEFIGLTETKKFTVRQYELPKFEVKVELAPFALTTDETLTGTINANYTYGEGVKGMAEVRVFVGPIRNYCGNLAKSVHKAFPVDGSADFSIPLSEIKKLQSYLNHQTITVVADVKEELTGKTLNGTSKVTYYDKQYTVKFLESSPNTFKPGLPYTAYVKLSQQDGRPVDEPSPEVSVFTCVTYQRQVENQNKYDCPTFTGNYALPSLTLTVPPSGIVPVDVDIPDNITEVRMRVYYKADSVYNSLVVSKSESKSATYIQARLRSQNIKAGDQADISIQATTPPKRVFYQISSRGTTVHSGVLEGDGVRKEVNLDFTVTPTMAPTSRLLVHFVKEDGEIVADSITFNVDGVFENEVSIGFEGEMAAPHDNATVNVNADVNSVVYLLAVDQSVLLLKSGNDITTDGVMDELRSYGGRGTKPQMARWGFPVPSSGKNADQIFELADVVVITDALLYAGEIVRYYSPMARRRQHSPSFGGPAEMSFDLPAPPSVQNAGEVTSTLDLADVERTREIFPETWLWMNTTITSDTGSRVTVEVPDTITSWVASAFAIHPDTGLGVAPTTAKMKVFRPFFVSVSLPVSVVRGEKVVLQANVFNYLDNDQTVVVEMKANAGFRSILIGDKEKETETSDPQSHRVTVPAGEGKAVYFPIIPAKLGMVDIEVSARTPVAADAVKRKLNVKAEGFRKELNIPAIIDLTDNKRLSKTLKVDSPPGLVEGSESIRLSVTGDIVGPSIAGVEDLLALPTGCGEQNMLRFAPNVYIADYLSLTNQTTPELDKKIKTFLELGFQRQLSYQRRDGSFSTFGDSDEAGSVWLTAFVIKSFHHARKYIYIDEDIIDKALGWLIRKQTTKGAFVEPGKVIDKQLQGEGGSGAALTSYVLVALMESNGHNGTRVNATFLKKAQTKTATYLSSISLKSLETYPLGITTYALQLAGSKRANRAFSQYKKKATNSPTMKHWDVKKDKSKAVDSMDIIASSYGLMIFTARGKYSPGTPIMNWIVAQRTPRGGFKSSQDTVIALEALTKYLAHVQPKKGYNIQMTITHGGQETQVEITNNNALVLQNFDLQSVPDEIVIEAMGVGMASVNLGIFYNVVSEGDTSDVFDVSTVLLDDTINGFTLMTCAKHLEEGSSGMCVESIQIPSGFTPDMSSTGNIAGLKRLEQEGQTVIAYFDQVGKSSTCITLACSRTDMVAQSKPVYISMVDYYKPNDNTIVSYQPRQLKKSKICEVCRGMCEGCM